MIVSRTVTNETTTPQIYYDYKGEPHTLAPGASLSIQVDNGVASSPVAGGDLALDDLTDVTAPSPSDLQVLSWDVAQQKWVPKTPTASAPGGAAKFTDLTDVPQAYGAEDAGKVATVNAAHDGLEFVAPPVGGVTAFTALSDVPQTYEVADVGKVVGVNAAHNGLEFMAAPAAAPMALGDLTDISVFGAAEGDVLTFASASGLWTAAPAPGAEGPLQSHTDVALSTPNNGDVIAWNEAGPYWEPVPQRAAKKRSIIWEPNGANVSIFAYGSTAPTQHGSGSKYSANDADWEWLEWRDFSPAGALYAANDPVYTSWDLDFYCRIKTMAVVTGMRFCLGLRMSGANDADYPDADAAVFMAHDDGNFFACTRSGAGHTEVDTGVPHAVNTVYEFEMLTTAFEIIFKINGTVVATIATDIPAAGWPCIWHLVDGARSQKFGLLRIDW